MNRHPAQIPETLWNDLTVIAVEKTTKTGEPQGTHGLIIQILKNSIAARKRIKERKAQKAFTLIELVVAVALLAMILFFANVIFGVGIKSYRIAIANAEIMRNLRAITDQLNLDVKAIRKNMPCAIYFEHNKTRMAFFATGNFESIRRYEYIDPNGVLEEKTVSGNAASIYWGQTEDGILARKLKILTYDPCYIDSPALEDKDEYSKRDSLAEWRVRNPADYFDDWIAPIAVDLNLPEDIVFCVSQGVSDFSIQLMMWNNVENRFTYWPDDINEAFGVFFNISNMAKDGWFPLIWDYPKAFKFCFTLYDSKNIINGRRFTHVVYVAD